MNPVRFDADANAQDAEILAHLCAYNTAFDELGLRFRWDLHTLTSLAAKESELAGIAAYIETHHAHLLKAYSMEFLSRAIFERKSARCPEALRMRVENLPCASRVVNHEQANSPRERVAYDGELPALAGA